MAEIGDDIVVGRWNVAVGYADLEYENVAPGPAGHGVVTAIAAQDVISPLAFQRVVAAVAGDDVVELRTPHRIDAANERVVTNRDIAVGDTRTARAERNHDAGGRVIEGNTGIAVTGDGVVTTGSLKFVEGGAAAIDAGASGVGAARRESSCVVIVYKIRAPNPFNGLQRIGADVDAMGRIDRRDGACRELHADARARERIAVDGAVETAAAVNQIVAAQSLEILGRARRIVAAGERVVEERAANAINAGKGVVSD